MIETANTNWRELCEAISREYDPEKLLDLLRQINEVLSEQRGTISTSQPGHA